MSPLVHGPFAARPPGFGRLLKPWRHWLAQSLRHGSRQLRQWAKSLETDAAHPAPTVPRPECRLEYHAETGAPEGALFIDGEYVGHLPVRRL